jgi:probable HAF family extracellular repeat protein
MKVHALLYPLPGVFALAACSSMTGNLEPTSAAHKDPTLHYAVTDLGPAGSPFAQATWLNNSGVVTGLAIGPDGASHSILWSNGALEDISQPGLGGTNSGAFGINQSGQVVGEAETSKPDPNNENVCGYGTGLQCLAFLWKDGVMTPLEPLGGTNSGVSGINSRGEIAGIAETANKDPECPAKPLPNGIGPLQFDYEAVVWGPSPGTIRELSPEAGDTVGIANGINDAGQVVGVSGRCGNTVPPGFVAGPHAVLWDADGTVHDLGSFGGTSNLDIAAVGNAAIAINNSGTVIGTSALPGNQVNQPFIWTNKTGMQHLALLPGDVVGAGLSINNGGEVVGASITQGGPATGNPKAVLWQNGADGSVINLNNYAAGTSFDNSNGGQLLTAFSINDAGEIAGFGVTSEGEIHAFLAAPCDANSLNCQDGTVTTNAERSKVTLTDDARRMFLRLGMRGH